MGGLRIFTQALRNQLESSNVRIIEILPPVVETPMTAGRGRNNEVYVSKTKLLYWLARISPNIASKIMRKLG
jgi:uncharacterized oxidoreductase